MMLPAPRRGLRFALALVLLALLTPAWRITANGPFTATGSMAHHNWGATATLLPDGTVLVAGGLDINNTPTLFTHPEIYDPATGAFSPTFGNMVHQRYQHTATRLQDGKVLLAGGIKLGAAGAPAELYDPISGTFTAVAEMTVPRMFHTATLLPNGTVLFTGGQDVEGGPFPVATAEIYDPVTQTFSATGSMSQLREYHAASLLPNGTVLVTGGMTPVSGGEHASAEIYDPATGTFSPTGSMSVPRFYHSSNVLPNGTVLMTGGYGLWTSAEIYNPATGTFTPTGSQMSPHYSHAAVTLADGRVLVAGGWDWQAGGLTSLAEVYDPNTGAFAAVGNMTDARFNFMAALLDDGTVLLAGGRNGSYISSAEIFQPSSTPIANADHYSISQGSTLTVAAPGVLTNDYLGPNSQASIEFDPPQGFSLTNLGGTGAFIFTPPPSFVGTAQFSYRIHSSYGDSNTATITIDVNDTTPPQLSLPSSFTVYAPNGGGTFVTYNPSATDANDGPRPVFCSPAPNTNFPIGTTTVSCSSSDSHGNTVTGSFNVTVLLRVLTSITVDPPMATRTTGSGGVFYTATGHYNDGTSQQLSSSSPGGGGPPRWSGHLTPGLNINVCTTPAYPPSSVLGGLSIFGFAEDPSTHSIIPSQWSTATPIVEISGTIDDSQVHVTFACSLSGFSGTASFHGVYDGMKSKYVGTFTGFDGVTTGAGALTGWSTKASMTDARFAAGAATVQVGGQDVIYVIGGSIGTAFTPEVRAYHPDPDTWTTHGVMPTSREGVGVATLNGLIYAAGGHETGGIAGTRVEVYDPVANSWSTRASMNTPRAEFALVAANGYLFALGGQQASNNPTPIASVERYDPVLDTWTPMADMPHARSFMAAGTLNILGQTTIVTAGGAVGSNATDLYDVATDTWRAGAASPSQGGTSAGGVVNNTLWVITTNGNGTSTAGYFPETSGLNGHPDGWAVLDSMTTPRGEIAVAVANGDVLFTFGGNDGTPNHPYSTTEALTTPPVGDLFISQGGGTAALSWTSSNPVVATIDQNGNATPLAPGATTIVASAGGISCVSTNTCGQLTVTNDPPSVQIFGGGPSSLPVGQPFSTNGSFFDTATDNPWTATVDYGDGGGPQPLSLQVSGSNMGPTGSFSLNHTYLQGGTFTITVRVTDKFGATGTATRTVNVNAPPVITLNTPFAQANEGSSFNGSGSFTDNPASGGGNWNVKVSYGDNTPDSFLPSMGSPGGFNFNHTYRDNGVYTVTVTVTDPNFLQAQTSAPVTVNNVAPAINLQATAGPFSESNSPNWNVSGSITDPGTFDFNGSNGGVNPQPGQWSATVNYGDNTGLQPLNITSSNNSGGNGPATLNFNLGQHAYPNSGVYTVTVTVRDKDGAVTSKTMAVTVSNVAPQVFTGGSATVQEGTTFTRSNLNFNDPSPNDGWTLTADWGDGSPIQNIPFTTNPNNFPRGTFSLSHFYADNGAIVNNVTTPYTVTVTVTDQDGGTSSSSFQVTVNNQPPDLFVDFSNLPDVEHNVPFTASGFFFDAGANDAPWTGTINFGDGSPVANLSFQTGNLPPNAPPGARGTFTVPSHTYTQTGTFTWNLTIRDKDGGFRSRQVQVSVDPTLVSIVVTPNAPLLSAVGATQQFTGVVTFSDGSSFSTADPPSEHTPFWFSTNPAVATVNQQGLATAVGPGVTIIGVGDPTGNPSCLTIGSCATLTVAAPAPPTIDSIVASQPMLWPPNHKYQAETITAVAHAANGADISASCTIVSATSDEPDNGLGDGDTANDIVITGAKTLNLRAERSGSGDGRVYTITMTCTDAAGRSATGTTTVTVPHSK